MFSIKYQKEINPFFLFHSLKPFHTGHGHFFCNKIDGDVFCLISPDAVFHAKGGIAFVRFADEFNHLGILHTHFYFVIIPPVHFAAFIKTRLPVRR